MKRFFLLLAACSFTLGSMNCASKTQPPNSGGKATPPTATNAKFEALPETALKAIISIPNAPTKLKAGEPATIRALVKNNSDTAWPVTGLADGKYRVQLGNHWLAVNNKVLTLDDARTPIPNNLEPGKEVELSLTVNAPKTPGEYILELDMVQEQVAWFKDKGSATTRAQVKVE